MNNTLSFKIASKSWEFEAVHRLNYQTFVEEIPQHAINKEGKLIDKFHEHNTYIICLKNNKLLGMISINDIRPFSLDNKIENVNVYLPSFRSICEIRLLSIVPGKRNGAVLSGIFIKLFEVIADRKYDLGIISGITTQENLYKRLGFKAFGTLVGAENAQFQPMYATFTAATKYKTKFKSLKKITANYLPGPVSIGSDVMNSYTENPVSHRSIIFMDDFFNLRKLLCQRLNTKEAYFATGGGTFANDLVASQLSKIKGRGIILINGEFGQRLENHAKRANLDYDVYVVDENMAFTGDFLEKNISNAEKYRWLWLVHCETSTGVLNDVSSIQNWCEKNNNLLCVDAISTIGSCAVDLKGVYLASATSGKGIGSLPGLAIILSSGVVDETNCLVPRCFDLSRYADAQGVPYTISSNAIYALIAALNKDWKKHFNQVAKWSYDFRLQMQISKFKIVANQDCRAPHITTIALPSNISSLKLGEKMLNVGILISYNSEYLLQKNWVQVCFMGDCQPMKTKTIENFKHFVSAVNNE